MRGPKVPSFIDKNMISEKQLFNLVAGHLEGASVFPVEVLIRSGNRITVYLDGDHGVTIDDCRTLNRFLESKLDREQEDFDLTVSSAGADQPLKVSRQYPQHTGRELKVILDDGTTLQGKLVTASSEAIEIEPSTGKKELKKEHVTLAFGKIREARVVLSFKK